MTITSATETTPDPVASYSLLRTPGSAADTFSIYVDGALAYHASKKSHHFGSDELTISASPNAQILVAAKLKASSKECKVRSGAKGDWQTVQSTDALGTSYRFGAGGNIWKRLNRDPATGNISEMALGHMHLESASGDLLGVYYLHPEGSRNAEGQIQIGKLDFLTGSLGKERELEALIAVIGLVECRALDARSRDLPLQHGVFPNGVPGPAGWK